MPAIFFLTLPPAGETYGQADMTTPAPIGARTHVEPALPFESVFERLKATAFGSDPLAPPRDPRGF
jgi:hypothetical protein